MTVAGLVRINQIIIQSSQINDHLLLAFDIHLARIAMLRYWTCQDRDSTRRWSIRKVEHRNSKRQISLCIPCWSLLRVLSIWLEIALLKWGISRRRMNEREAMGGGKPRSTTRRPPCRVFARPKSPIFTTSASPRRMFRAKQKCSNTRNLHFDQTDQLDHSEHNASAPNRPFLWQSEFMRTVTKSPCGILKFLLAQRSRAKFWISSSFPENHVNNLVNNHSPCTRWRWRSVLVLYKHHIAERYSYGEDLSSSSLHRWISPRCRDDFSRRSSYIWWPRHVGRTCRDKPRRNCLCQAKLFFPVGYDLIPAGHVDRQEVWALLSGRAESVNNKGHRHGLKKNNPKSSSLLLLWNTDVYFDSDRPGSVVWGNYVYYWWSTCPDHFDEYDNAWHGNAYHDLNQAKTMILGLWERID